MDGATWAIVFATLLGPVLAVQAQKWIERGRARSKDKEDVFRTLMATRAARLSLDHVQALNMIDIAYRAGQPAKRTLAETAVTERWAEYRGHLFTDMTDKSDTEITTWNDNGRKLFAEMLKAMATERGHEFDKHALGAGGYFPLAHGHAQSQQESVRSLLLDILNGNKSLSMTIKEMPTDRDWNGKVLSELEAIRHNTK